MKHKVEAWKDKLVIPTYEVGKPEKYPLFLDKRVYQGSSGVVYPYPVIEKISDSKTDKVWEVVYIENAFIKIMVLPALGGRIQMAYDKIRERHFIYHNEVIKPALVGLTGPWLSGGIEFNWPQHHRPSTYEPVDYSIEENEDGSMTVWVSEVERMFRTKGMAGFTLYPDNAYLEVKVQLYNRTPHPQTFLWWANPAVSVNEHYQSVFPPDVHAVFDHGRRDVSEFPIAKGHYYHVDYSPGTDISRYKNIPVPTSYMAASSDYDFLGGYENDSQGGVLHVADHHLSPGKKQWTWGNGEFGHAWDRNLTDSDGPYVELMCGVYTDNQPDFSWLEPYEEKSFSQYFLPYHHVGRVKNATKEALVNIEFDRGKAIVKLYVTAEYPGCQIELIKGDVAFHDVIDLDPSSVYEEEIEIESENYNGLRFKLSDQHGNILVSWVPDKEFAGPIPEPAKAILDPAEISSIEELFLSGLHLEQYRHATYDPTDYYREALRRSPTDVRCNNAMGLWHLKRCKLEKALEFFNTSIHTLTEKNPNPYDGEPYFNKGITLQLLGQDDEAYEAFYKACWNASWQDSGYFHLAQIACKKWNFEEALTFLDKALIRNWHNHKARHLKAIILRKLSREKDALELIEESNSIDKFNYGILFEKYLISLKNEDLTFLIRLMRDNVHSYIEFSLDYADAGFYEEGIAFLQVHCNGKANVYPMVYYFLGWYNFSNHNSKEAGRFFDAASRISADYCFPNRVEEVIALQSALDINPKDAKALYYLGNFWYANKQYEDALNCWDKSISNDDRNAICWRNLSLLYFNKKEQKDLAQKYLERAFSEDQTSSRLLMELDQLHSKINTPLPKRLCILEEHMDLVVERDDLYLEWISLHTLTGQHEKALQLLQVRHFHPWEGGEGKVPLQYVTNQIELAKEYFIEKQYTLAINCLEAAKKYPACLGEGKLHGTQENDLYFWLGCVYQELSETEKSEESWRKATSGKTDPGPAFFYNDQQSDKLFYKGVSHILLGEKEKGIECFNKLISYGNDHMEDEVRLDYFAVSLPDLLLWETDLNTQNRLFCTYLSGLGYLGMGNEQKAKACFKKVLAQDQYHLSTSIHLKMVRNKVLNKYLQRRPLSINHV